VPRTRIAGRVGALAAAALVLLGGGAAPASAAESPQVAVDPDGDATFVWTRWNGGNHIAQTRTRSADGTLSAIQNVSETGVDAETPQVAIAPDGTATFVWTRWNGANRVVQSRTRSADGTLTAIQTLSEGPNSPSRIPQVAVDADGDATFVWHWIWYHVQARTRSASGVLGPVHLVSGYGGFKADVPQVGVDADGDATFAFQRLHNGAPQYIHSRTLSAAGVLGPLVQVSVNTGRPDSPQVAVDPDGDATFTWRRQIDTFLTIQTRTRSGAGTWSGFQNVSAGGQHSAFPEVGVDPAGNATFAWRRFNGTTHVVQARVRSAAGVLSATQDISRPGPVQAPQLAVDPNGNAAFTWSRWNGTYHAVQARWRGADGTLAAVQDLSAGGRDASVPQVGIDATGDATFVWKRWNGSSWIIQTRTRSPAGTLTPVQSLSPLVNP
jgi:hypothetical protein